LVALATVAAFPHPSSAAPRELGGSAGQLGAAKAETATFVAEISAIGTYSAGSEGTVLVTLTPKGEYHINPQYPYKFKAPTPAPDGLSYPKPVLVRGDGQFEEKRATFKLPFTASKSGSMSVGGTLHLSVCSAANCIVDKVVLELSVDVK